MPIQAFGQGPDYLAWSFGALTFPRINVDNAPISESVSQIHTSSTHQLVNPFQGNNMSSTAARSVLVVAGLGTGAGTGAATAYARVLLSSI